MKAKLTSSQLITGDNFKKTIDPKTRITTVNDIPLGIECAKHIWYEMAEHATFEGDKACFESNGYIVHIEQFKRRSEFFYRLIICKGDEIICKEYYRPLGL